MHWYVSPGPICSAAITVTPDWFAAAKPKVALPIAGRGASLCRIGTKCPPSRLLPPLLGCIMSPFENGAPLPTPSSPLLPPLAVGAQLTHAPIEWGNTSNIMAFRNSHNGTTPETNAACIARPCATAVSAEMEVHNSGWIGGGNLRRSMVRIVGMRVDPPTRTTSCIKTLPERLSSCCCDSFNADNALSTTHSARSMSGCIAESNSCLVILISFPERVTLVSGIPATSLSLLSPFSSLPHSSSLARRHRLMNS
mmetsp:Transcript_7445/g.13119  ORF Transcript_7445/g.13119 Transcript_7445/m.13119 type:complete len:253 (+) Transcript_7445:598-1356(+)